MTLGQAKEATGAALSCAEKFLPYLSDTCVRYAIDTPARQLCFFAQVGHESGGLYYTEELASGQAYEGRVGLGNTQPGDGVRFKGRGLIQITGRANYYALSTALTIDLLANPTLLGGKNVEHCTPDQLRYAALSAGWFWSKNGLNALADKILLTHPIDEGPNLDYFKQITRRINGGYNGLPDRLFRFKNGAKHFLDI
ncbi:glycoside hydrolase family 19 protein [Spirosoma arcticum]